VTVTGGKAMGALEISLVWAKATCENPQANQNATLLNTRIAPRFIKNSFFICLSLM
jgi:hypothetical protein